MIAQTLPLWAKQVESARRKTDEAVVALSSCFEGIAFQTNMLALNAAIEAAHAGVADKISRWSRTRFWLCRRPPERRASVSPAVNLISTSLAEIGTKNEKVASREQEGRAAGAKAWITKPFQPQLLAELTKHPRVTELDLSRVLEIDTAGLQVLLTARRHARDAGRELTVRAPSRAVTEVLELCRLGALMAQPTTGAPDSWSMRCWANFKRS